MADFTKLFDAAKELAIRNWVYNATTIQTVWAFQDGERPAKPFISLSIISGPTQDGAPAQDYKELDTYTYQFKYTFTLSINIFTDDGHLEISNNILQARNLATKRAILRQAGLAIHGEPSIISFSEVLDTDHELRATVDITFAFGSDIDDVSGEIATVNIAGTGELDRIIKSIS